MLTKMYVQRCTSNMYVQRCASKAEDDRRPRSTTAINKQMLVTVTSVASNNLESRFQQATTLLNALYSSWHSRIQSEKPLYILKKHPSLLGRTHVATLACTRDVENRHHLYCLSFAERPGSPHGKALPLANSRSEDAFPCTRALPPHLEVARKP